MNKAELIAAVAASAEISKKDAETAVSAALNAITNALKEGDKVQIVGFGTFSVREREEHEARNPATGEPVTVAASKTPVFKPGKSFKEAF